MLDPAVADRGHDDAGPAGQAGQDGGGLVERFIERAALCEKAGFDGAFVVLGDIADLQQAVDEQAQARMGRQAPGAGVGRAQQAKRGEVLHGVADRGRRQADPGAGQGAGTDRLAGFEILLDDAPEDIARAAVELAERGAGRCGRQRAAQGDAAHVGRDLWGVLQDKRRPQTNKPAPAVPTLRIFPCATPAAFPISSAP
jgi:hypothetical protein